MHAYLYGESTAIANTASHSENGPMVNQCISIRMCDRTSWINLFVNDSFHNDVNHTTKYPSSFSILFRTRKESKRGCGNMELS